LGVNLEGKKELLGLWLAETEGAKFWLTCLTDLQNRGLRAYPKSLFAISTV
jgi:putative transposase